MVGILALIEVFDVDGCEVMVDAMSICAGNYEVDPSTDGWVAYIVAKSEGAHNSPNVVVVSVIACVATV